MRILLDECLPRKLKSHLPGHSVMTVPEMGWAGTKDRLLLQLAAAEFDALVTVDRAFPRTAGPSTGALIIVQLGAPSNRVADLEPLMPIVLQRLAHADPGMVILVSAERLSHQ